MDTSNASGRFPIPTGALSCDIMWVTDFIQNDNLGMNKQAQVSRRAELVPVSPIRKLMPLAKSAQARGVKVHPLNIGQPDLDGPREFFEGISGFSHHQLGYESAKGNEELCNNWSAFMNRSIGVQTTPEQFIITLGASEALLYAFIACCDPGDEIIVFDPTYTNYIGLAHAAAIRLSPILTTIEQGFAIGNQKEKIQAAISPRTKAILVCNPNNPTGSVYTKAELLEILELCEKNGLYLIVDECYREMVFDNLAPVSILNLAPTSDKIVIVDSLSKRFCLCGSRVGCLISTNQLILGAVTRLAQTRLAAPSIEQWAAARLLSSISTEWIRAVRDEYQDRRDVAIQELRKIPDAKIHTPLGAFYTVIELPVSNADDFARFLLEEFQHNGYTTFITPATGFYVSSGVGNGQFRLAFVVKGSSLVEAITAINLGLAQYLQSH